MIYRIYGVVFGALLAWPAGAQDRGVLAIDEGTARHAFSFDSEADAVNMCGTTGCEVVATFSACLAVGYSSVTTQQEQSVWTWIEADTEGTARREALDECEQSGGLACEVLNAYCVADSASSPAAPAATGQQPAAANPELEGLFWQSIMDSTNPAEFEAYLAQFPNGVFRALASARLAALRAPGRRCARGGRAARGCGRRAGGRSGRDRVHAGGCAAAGPGRRGCSTGWSSSGSRPGNSGWARKCCAPHNR